MEQEFGLGVQTSLGFSQAVVRTRIALRAHGFSILSEMPAPAGIGEETGRRHLFLGVWERLIKASNLGGPGLDVGDHLPCNVVVYEQGESTVIAGLDPSEGMEGWEPAGGQAQEARKALEAAFAEIVEPEE
jgi:uncharacterized protein (DUF302 family)